MPEWPELHRRIQAPRHWCYDPALGGGALSIGEQFKGTSQRLVPERFAECLASRRHLVPPDERSSPFQLDPRALLEARAGKRDQLIGQVLQISALAYRYCCVLRCDVIRRAASVYACCARRSHLRLCTRRNVDLPLERVRIENAARYVVQVRQCFTRRRPETTHDSPGWLLLLDAKNRAAPFTPF